jgi:hypothetical protein
MSSERLRSNTPSKWKEKNPGMEGLKTFILVSLLSFAVLATIFLVVYLVKPLEVKVFIRNINEWINK